MGKRVSEARRHDFSEEIGPHLFRFEHYREERIGRVLLHYHPQYELALLRGVSGQRLVGDHVASFSGGDLVLIGPNLPHGWVTDEAAVHGVSREIFVVIFTEASIGLDLLGRPELEAVKHLLARANRGFAFPAATRARVEPAISALGSAGGARRACLFFEILVGLSDAAALRPLVSKDYSLAGASREQDVFRRVLTRIHTRDSQAIALAEAASEAGMSVPTFTRFFRRMTGMTFVTYLNRWRVERACIRLRHTQDHILDIAIAVGYGNLSHFNRQFRKFQGMTPREYRRRARESVEPVRSE